MEKGYTHTHTHIHTHTHMMMMRIVIRRGGVALRLACLFFI